MAKSTFSPKLIIIDKKTVKNDQKLINIYDTKTGHNLTTKTGDSGSAGMLGEKCVMIEAPKLVTKIDTKLTQQQKMMKIDQKSVKSKIIKNMKIIKTQKVTKSRK